MPPFFEAKGFIEMKKMKQQLIIPFSGLKEGLHQFDFDVDSTFFEQFENSIIENAEVHIDVDFLKKKNMLQLNISMKGTVHTTCDRCTEEIDIDVEGDEELIVKFGDEEFEQTDEIKIIPVGAYELNISKEVYDYIHLLLPTKIEHEKEEDCNQEVIAKLKELSIKNKKEDTEHTDPRWAALLNLKDNSEN